MCIYVTEICYIGQRSLNVEFSVFRLVKRSVVYIGFILLSGGQETKREGQHNARLGSGRCDTHFVCLIEGMGCQKSPQ